jgi:hypothetical protein
VFPPYLSYFYAPNRRQGRESPINRSAEGASGHVPKESTKKNTSANLGFEAQMWATAGALCSKVDTPEYKHVVLGLIFLKHISDAFDAKHAELHRR